MSHGFRVGAALKPYRSFTTRDDERNTIGVIESNMNKKLSTGRMVKHRTRGAGLNDLRRREPDRRSRAGTSAVQSCIDRYFVPNRNRMFTEQFPILSGISAGTNLRHISLLVDMFLIHRSSRWASDRSWTGAQSGKQIHVEAVPSKELVMRTSDYGD